MTRSHRRPLVAGILAATAVLTTGLLSACGAGQIAQTSQVQPGVAGVNTEAPNHKVVIRDAALDYNGENGYPKGSNAPISLWIFNNLTQPVSLVGVASRGQVLLAEGKNTNAPCAVPRSLTPAPASPLSSTPALASPSASPAKPSGSGRTASPSVAPSSASPSASLSPSPSLGSATINVTIPAGGCVELTRRAAHYLQVVELPVALHNTDRLPVLFEFTTQDGQSFTIGSERDPVRLPIAVPESPLPHES